MYKHTYNWHSITRYSQKRKEKKNIYRYIDEYLVTIYQVWKEKGTY